MCGGGGEYFYDSNSRTCALCDDAAAHVFSSILFVLIQIFLWTLLILVGLVGLGYLLSKFPSMTCLKFIFDNLTLIRNKIIYVYENLAKTKVTLLVVWMQIVSEISGNCTVVFPTATEDLLTSLSVLNLHFSKFMAIPCWSSSDSDYIDDLLFMTMFPLGLFASMAALYRLPICFQRTFRSQSTELENRKKRATRKSLYTMPSELKQQQFSTLEIDALRRTFGELDTNCNGIITSDELVKVIREIEGDLDDEAVERVSVSVFKETETESNKEITFGDFVRYIHKGRQADNQRATDFGNLMERVKAKVLKERQSLLVQVALIISFTVLIGTSAALFNYFRCIKYDTVTVMALDYSLQCDSTRYAGFIVYVVIMVIIYPIGIPLAYAVLLWQHRNTLQSHHEMAMQKANGYPEVKMALLLLLLPLLVITLLLLLLLH